MSNNETRQKAQIIFFSHGGGPLPILGDASHQAMIDFMTEIPSHLQKPDCVLVVSAHWEEQTPTLLGAANPPLYYDYYGFPDQAYEITYPAPGDPELAKRVESILENEQIPTQIDPKRGFDHGVFIPLKMMYPEADIPVNQLSLLRGLDAAQHLALGKALQSLKDENVLVVGSGFSFHNMHAFFSSTSGSSDPQNDAFQDWLIETCTGPRSSDEREDRLLHWDGAPFARYCHPREEHLLPLLVCTALAESPAEVIFDDQIFRKRAVAFLWQ